MQGSAPPRCAGDCGRGGLPHCGRWLSGDLLRNAAQDSMGKWWCSKCRSKGKKEGQCRTTCVKSTPPPPFKHNTRLSLASAFASSAASSQSPVVDLSVKQLHPARGAQLQEPSSLASSPSAMASSFIFVYSPNEQWDNFPVSIENTEDLLLKGPYSLLAHNVRLLQPLLWPDKKAARNKGTECKRRSDGGVVEQHLL